LKLELSLNLNIFELILLSFSLIFILEGVLYTLLPSHMRKVFVFILNSEEDKIRIIGFIFFVLGIIILYLFFL